MVESVWLVDWARAAVAFEVRVRAGCVDHRLGVCGAFPRFA
jgi:hypothetical protein